PPPAPPPRKGAPTFRPPPRGAGPRVVVRNHTRHSDFDHPVHSGGVDPARREDAHAGRVTPAIICPGNADPETRKRATVFGFRLSGTSRTGPAPIEASAAARPTRPRSRPPCSGRNPATRPR